MYPILEKLKPLYKWYVLALVSIGYVIGELGHFLIGVTSRATAKDLHYGDKSCMYNVSSGIAHHDMPATCETANSTEM